MPNFLDGHDFEDGSGWSGLVPTKAEREQERREQQQRQKAADQAAEISRLQSANRELAEALRYILAYGVSIGECGPVQSRPEDDPLPVAVVEAAISKLQQRMGEPPKPAAMHCDHHPV